MKRRIRYSLKSLFIAVAFVSIVLGVACRWWTQYRRANLAVDRLWQVEGMPYYSFEIQEEGGTIKVRNERTWNDDLFFDWGPVLDPDMFYSVVAVTFENSYPSRSNRDLEILKNFPDLKYLHLSANPRFTDDAVPYLADLTSLRRLNIDRTGITRDGYERLCKALPDTYVYWREDKAIPLEK